MKSTYLLVKKFKNSDNFANRIIEERSLKFQIEFYIYQI